MKQIWHFIAALVIFVMSTASTVCLFFSPLFAFVPDDPKQTVEPWAKYGRWTWDQPIIELRYGWVLFTLLCVTAVLAIRALWRKRVDMGLLVMAAASAVAEGCVVALFGFVVGMSHSGVPEAVLRADTSRSGFTFALSLITVSVLVLFAIVCSSLASKLIDSLDRPEVAR